MPSLLTTRSSLDHRHPTQPRSPISIILAYNRKATRLHQRPVSIEYEIERIITDRSTSKQQEFRCKWKDFPLHQSPWLPKSLLNNAQETLTQYLTSPNPHPNPIDICQVTCCGENATAYNPECKIQPRVLGVVGTPG